MTIWGWQLGPLRQRYEEDGWRIWESRGQVIAERDGERISVSAPAVLEVQLEDARWKALTRRQSW